MSEESAKRKKKPSFRKNSVSVAQFISVSHK